MLGGDERVCDTLRPLLDCYASKVPTQPTAAHALSLTSLSVPSTQVLHFGPVGSGMAAKLVNQALVCVHAQAAAEAIYLAEHMGLLRGRCVFTRHLYKPLYRPLYSLRGRYELLTIRRAGLRSSSLVPYAVS